MDQTQLARRQYGVLLRHQAVETGTSIKAIRCHLRAGRWQRIHPGVYLTHSGEVSWMIRASAAVLRAGRGAVLTLGSAAHLWGLDKRQPPVITVAVPADRTVTRAVGTRIRRRRRLENTTARRLPVTSVAQTVIDLAAESGHTADEAVAGVATACRRDKVTPAQLLEELHRRRTHPHRALLQVALGDVDDGVESVAEFRFVDDVERAHGLPPLVRQAVVGVPGSTDGGNVRRARRDFESVEYGTVVEIDGELWHRGAAFTEDRRRDREAAREGKVTLRAGWVDVAVSPCDLALDVGLTLQQRGWAGRLTPCGPGCAVARTA